MQHRTFALKYVNGKLASKRLATSVRTAEPIAKILKYGTKKRPYSVPGADNLNWGALARCESGDNPRSVSSGGTYRGLYQFTIGTWESVGGHGDIIFHRQARSGRRGDSYYDVGFLGIEGVREVEDTIRELYEKTRAA